MTSARALGRAASALMMLAASCTGTEVGNPVAEPIRVALTARSSSGDVALAGDAGVGNPSVVLDHVWVSLGDARFVIDEDCSAMRDTRIVVDGPFIADLALAPSVLADDLPQGNYCSVRVSLERATASDAGAPDALTGHSVVLQGRREDGVAFTLRSRDKPDFVLRGRADAISVTDARNALFLAFDTGAWLDGVDLASAVPNAAGDVVIEPGQDDARLRTFETNLRRSLALFKDGNADGELAADEATSPLAD